MSSYQVTRLTSSQISGYTPTNGQIVYNTTTNQFQFYQNGSWDIITGGFVTSVATGTGLTGGPITSTGTISIANTAVSAGSYNVSNITVNAQGQITAATGLSSAGVVVTNGSGVPSAVSNLIDTGSGGNLGLGLLIYPSITTGTNNIAIGYQSQNAVTTGIANTSVGYQSLVLNAAGQENCAFGAGALKSLNAAGSNNNVAVGWESGFAITTTNSANNTFVGSQSGGARTSYSSCTLIGALADCTSNGLNHSVAIGSGVTVGASNSCVIGQANSTGFVTVGLNIVTPVGNGLHIGNAGGAKNPALVIDTSTSALTTPATTNQIQINSFNGKPALAANVSQYSGTVVTAQNTTSASATCGTATLNGATAVVISTTSVQTTSLIFVTRNAGTGAPNSGTAVGVGSIVAGTSFSIVSSMLDTATVNWLIINP